MSDDPELTEEALSMSALLMRMEEIHSDVCARVEGQAGDLRWRMDAGRSALQEENLSLLNVINELRAQNNHLALSIADARADLHDLTMRGPLAPCELKLACEKPIALDSADHTNPWGTAHDNTRHPPFVQAIDRVFGKTITSLDMGCSGGGLVYELARAGHESLGVEGSDYSQRHRRAEWAVIPDRLFTGDITAPIKLTDKSGTALRCDLITAWEVLEHIPKDKLPGLFENLRALLAPDGIFVGSVAQTPDVHPVTGIDLHVTIETEEWWIDQIEKAGLRRIESPFEMHEYVRGSGNPRAMDWNAATNPEIGFHLALKCA